MSVRMGKFAEMGVQVIRHAAAADGAVHQIGVLQDAIRWRWR